VKYIKQAVALEYGMNAVPVVTAKADADLAEHLIEEARRQGVYVTEDPQLLALLSRLNVDDEIPPELYTAVAVILSWVYWLKGMRPGDETSPAGTDADSQAGAQGMPTEAAAMFDELSSGLDGLDGFASPGAR
jgi:flagellar biosynthesis protein